MAAEQAFPLVSGPLGGADRARVPGLDVELEPVQRRDGPAERGQRDQRRRRKAAPPGARDDRVAGRGPSVGQGRQPQADAPDGAIGDRKSTRLNSSHMSISYAVFCLKKKNT